MKFDENIIYFAYKHKLLEAEIIYKSGIFQCLFTANNKYLQA